MKTCYSRGIGDREKEGLVKPNNKYGRGSITERDGRDVMLTQGGHLWIELPQHHIIPNRFLRNIISHTSYNNLRSLIL